MGTASVFTSSSGFSQQGATAASDEKELTMKIRKHSAAFAVAAILTALAYPSVPGVASATISPTRFLSANGHEVTWTVTVPGYGWCTWWSSPRVPKFNKTQRCDGKTKRSATLKPNIGDTQKYYTFRLTFLGKKAKVTDWMKVTQYTKTTTSPPSSSSPPPPNSYCVGTSTKCVVVFPAVDDFGLSSLLVGEVYQNLACPDPGVCNLPSGDQLDAVVIGMGTGPSGMTKPSLELSNFSLVLAGGEHARIDGITCNSSVEYALCGLGPEAPNMSFGAAIFFDVPIGSNWTSVNFSYNSGVVNKLYVFTK